MPLLEAMCFACPQKTFKDFYQRKDSADLFLVILNGCGVYIFSQSRYSRYSRGPWSSRVRVGNPQSTTRGVDSPQSINPQSIEKAWL